MPAIKWNYFRNKINWIEFKKNKNANFFSDTLSDCKPSLKSILTTHKNPLPCPDHYFFRWKQDLNQDYLDQRDKV